MTILAALNPDMEQYLREIFRLLTTLCATDTIKTLLLQESLKKTRPIEEAARNCTLGLFQEMFETKGVHLKYEHAEGIYTTEFYDISEYESVQGERKYLNLLSLLSYLDTPCLQLESTKELFRKEYIQEWISHKTRKNLPFICVWSSWRFLQGAVYVVFDASMTIPEERMSALNGPEHTNDTSCLSREWVTYTDSNSIILTLGIFLLMQAFAGILCDVSDAVKLYFVWFRKHGKAFDIRKTPRGKKDFVLDNGDFEKAHCLVNVLIVCNVAVRLARLQLDLDLSLSVNIFFYWLILANIAHSAISFLQLVPSFGTIASITQRLGIASLKYFTTLYTLMSVVNTMVIYKVVNFGRTECDVNFRNVWTMWYSTFILVFNGFDFRYLQDELDTEQLLLALFFYVVFVTFVSLLVVNFFIALYTYNISRYMEYKEIYGFIETTTLLATCEFRMVKVGASCWLHSSEKKNFVSDDDGHIYITRTVFAKKDPEASHRPRTHRVGAAEHDGGCIPIELYPSGC